MDLTRPIHHYAAPSLQSTIEAMSQLPQTKESTASNNVSDDRHAKNLPPSPPSESRKRLPLKTKSPTRKSCPYFKYRLDARHGMSFFKLLGFPSAMKDNPLEDAIVSFIKKLEVEARWVVFPESALCWKALSSRALAKEFLDETLSDAKGREMWEAVGEDTLSKHAYKYQHVWHVLQHIFMRKQQSKNLGSYRNKSKDVEIEIEKPESEFQSESEIEPKSTLFTEPSSASGLFPKISKLPVLDFILGYEYLNSAESDQQCMCIARIKSLPSILFPLAELTKRWLLSEDGLWTKAATASLEMIMHCCSYYKLDDDGQIIHNKKFLDLIQELREGSEIYKLDGTGELRAFHRRIRQQVQSITRGLYELGFVDYDSNGDLKRCKGFDTEWKCREFHWKRTSRRTVTTRSYQQIFPERLGTQDVSGKTKLDTIHGHVVPPTGVEVRSDDSIYQVSAEDDPIVAQPKRKRQLSMKAHQNNGDIDARPSKRLRKPEEYIIESSHGVLKTTSSEQMLPSPQHPELHSDNSLNELRDEIFQQLESSGYLEDSDPGITFQRSPEPELVEDPHTRPATESTALEHGIRDENLSMSSPVTAPSVIEQLPPLASLQSPKMTLHPVSKTIVTDPDSVVEPATHEPPIHPDFNHSEPAGTRKMPADVPAAHPSFGQMSSSDMIQGSKMAQLVGNLNETFDRNSTPPDTVPAETLATELPPPKSASPMTSKVTADIPAYQPLEPASNNPASASSATSLNELSPSPSAPFSPLDASTKQDAQTNAICSDLYMPRSSSQYRISGDIQSKGYSVKPSEEERQCLSHNRMASSSKSLVQKNAGQCIQLVFITAENEHSDEMWGWDTLSNSNLEAFCEFFSEHSRTPLNSLNSLQLETRFGKDRKFRRVYNISRHDDRSRIRRKWQTIKDEVEIAFEKALEKAKQEPSLEDREFLIVVDRT